MFQAIGLYSRLLTPVKLRHLMEGLEEKRRGNTTRQERPSSETQMPFNAYVIVGDSYSEAIHMCCK